MRTRRQIAAAVLLLLSATIAFLAWRSERGNPDSATVGDCVSHRSGDDIKVVSCGDSKAAFKVMGKVKNKTEPEFDLDSGTICSPFPGAKSAFWKGEVGKAGYVLCMAPVR